MSRHPEVKWAQRSDRLFITIELPDAVDPKVKLEPEGKFTFFATAGKDNLPYELDLELFDKVNVEESKISVGLRHIICVIQKQEKKWWKQLVKTEAKRLPFLKVDWDKWVDEDEEHDSKFGSDMDFGDMDFSKLGMGRDQPFDDEELEDAPEEEPALDDSEDDKDHEAPQETIKEENGKRAPQEEEGNTEAMKVKE